MTNCLNLRETLVFFLNSQVLTRVQENHFSVSEREEKGVCGAACQVQFVVWNKFSLIKKFKNKKVNWKDCQSLHKDVILDLKNEHNLREKEKEEIKQKWHTHKSASIFYYLYLVYKLMKEGEQLNVKAIKRCNQVLNRNGEPHLVMILSKDYQEAGDHPTFTCHLIISLKYLSKWHTHTHTRVFWLCEHTQ